MTITDRILTGVRDLLRQQDKIDALTEAVKELTTEVRTLDRRVARIEGMIDGAALRAGRDRLSLPEEQG